MVYHIDWFVDVEKNPCIPGMNSTRSYDLFNTCWIWIASFLLKIFASLLIIVIGLKFSFMVVYLCLVLDDGALMKWVGAFFFPCDFLEQF